MVSIVLLLIGLLIFGILPASLIILDIASIIVIISYKWKRLSNYAPMLYLITFITSILALFFRTEVAFYFIVNGYIGYALFMVVMFTGILPGRLEITRSLYKNRGVFSILGFLLISPHAMNHLFFNAGTDLFGIVSYVLMVPLTFISFKVIRKEMSSKDWFQIQKIAYIIYITLFVHLLVVSEGIDTIFYAVFATLYINNKLIREFKT